MPHKDPETRQRYMAARHQRRRASGVVQAYARQRMLEADRQRAAAMRGGCVDCGETDRVVLHFDHVRGEKVCSPSNCAPGPKLDAELAKCDVRCANCHRRRHYQEKVNDGRRV